MSEFLRRLIEFALGLALQKDGLEQFQKYKTLLDEFVSDRKAKDQAEEFGMRHGYFSRSDRDDALAMFGLLSITPLLPIGVGGLLYVAGKSCKDAILSSYYHSQICELATEIRPIIDQAITTAQGEIIRLNLSL